MKDKNRITVIAEVERRAKASLEIFFAVQDVNREFTMGKNEKVNESGLKISSEILRKNRLEPRTNSHQKLFPSFPLLLLL